MTRKCKKCKEIKEIGCFFKNSIYMFKTKPTYCKECIINHKQIKKKNDSAALILKPKAINPAPVLTKKEKRKIYYIKNRKRLLKARKKYQKANPEKMKMYREKANKNAALYMRTRRKNDLNFKIRHYCGQRLRNALKQNQKKGSTLDYLGCSIEQLRQHLESKFKPGMTWETWGKYGWHIDHIIPLANFDLTDEYELRIACHYTNLQPLWAKENNQKKKLYLTE